MGSIEERFSGFIAEVMSFVHKKGKTFSFSHPQILYSLFPQQLLFNLLFEKSSFYHLSSFSAFFCNFPKGRGKEGSEMCGFGAVDMMRGLRSFWMKGGKGRGRGRERELERG